MHVKDIMTRTIETVRPDNTIQEAAERMKDLDVGPLPVCVGDQLIGIVTDRDITVRGTALGQDPWTEHVSDVMTRDVVCCYEDQDIQEAAQLMKDKQIRRLVVVDRNRRPTGIVSLGDLAVQCHDDKLSGETLERVSEPNQSQA
jgi:CBS domain-containing protein